MLDKPRLFETDSIAISQCKHGPMMYFRNDVIIGKSLDVYGEFYESEIDLLRQFIQPHQVIVDVGANIGTHTIPFAKLLGGTGAVLAFEPQRIVFNLLCANVALNDLFNVRCLPNAVSDQPATIAVPVVDMSAHSQNYGGISLNQIAPQSDAVIAYRLDDLNLAACHLIKIDVEGMEARVLSGARQTIQKYRPVLFVESNQVELASDINSTLFEMGYQAWWFLCKNFNPNNFRGHADDVFQSDYIESNLIALPQEMYVEIPGLQKLLGVDDHCRSAINRALGNS